MEASYRSLSLRDFVINGALAGGLLVLADMAFWSLLGIVCLCVLLGGLASWFADWVLARIVPAPGTDRIGGPLVVGMPLIQIACVAAIASFFGPPTGAAVAAVAAGASLPAMVARGSP